LGIQELQQQELPTPRSDHHLLREPLLEQLPLELLPLGLLLLERRQPVESLVQQQPRELD